MNLWAWWPPCVEARQGCREHKEWYEEAKITSGKEKGYLYYWATGMLRNHPYISLLFIVVRLMTVL